MRVRLRPLERNLLSRYTVRLLWDLVFEKISSILATNIFNTPAAIVLDCRKPMEATAAQSSLQQQIPEQFHLDPIGTVDGESTILQLMLSRENYCFSIAFQQTIRPERVLSDTW